MNVLSLLIAKKRIGYTVIFLIITYISAGSLNAQAINITKEDKQCINNILSTPESKKIIEENKEQINCNRDELYEYNQIIFGHVFEKVLMKCCTSPEDMACREKFMYATPFLVQKAVRPLVCSE